MLLYGRQVSRLLKAFAKSSSANIKLFKSHLPKIVQSGGLLSGILGPLLNAGLLLMKNILTPLAIKINNINISKRCSYSKENFWIGITGLIISKGEMEDIIKIGKPLEEPSLLITGVSKTIENKAIKLKDIFVMLYFLLCYIRC